MSQWVPYNLRWCLGILFVLCSLPFVAINVGSAVLWDFIDPITLRLGKKFTQLLEPIGVRVARHPKDGWMLAVLILQAVLLPLLFAWNLYATLNDGLSITRVWMYHLLRIGPYFQTFAYAYTMCHKEGHVKVIGMWKKPYSSFLSKVWNWWIGLFYGVMPSTFAVGHTVNHHRYDNDEKDIITTWDYPRDSFSNYLAYLPRFLAYHMNMSVIVQFVREGEYNLALHTLWGTVYYFVFYGVISYIHPTFAFVYLVYPLVEAGLLLSAINWAWHCFVDPDENNFFAYSITIFDGLPNTNILNEDYHVVHHQYPAVHWSEHPRLYEKHKQEYIDNQATIFRGTHAMEVFFLAILKQYDVFAEKFVDLNDKMTHEQKLQLVKTRIQTCTWGNNRDPQNTFKQPGAMSVRTSKSKSKKDE